MSITRPYSSYKITAVLSLAEVAVFDTLLINIVSRLYFDAGIDDRDQTDILILQFLYEFRKILKILFT